MEELTAFQNEDGGFGRALEPDLRTPASSALCTTLAFQVLRGIEAGNTDALVSRSMEYLMKTLDREEVHWRIVPCEAQKSPHAPWWNQEGRQDIFDSFSLNPTAEILGYLYDYRSFVPDEVINSVSDKVMHAVECMKSIEMHELLCCLRLMQTVSAPDAMKDMLRSKLTPLVKDAVALTPNQWRGYSLRPLQVVDSPDSSFMAEYAEAVSENLDFEIESQNRDGSWSPAWSWGDAYPEAWNQARKEWSGIITVNELTILKKFDRIEGMKGQSQG